jgi:hypothetical protein
MSDYLADELGKYIHAQVLETLLIAQIAMMREVCEIDVAHAAVLQVLNQIEQIQAICDAGDLPTLPGVNQ